MSNIRTIRERLGVTQAVLADGIGCTQGNIYHYEQRGQNVPPATAQKLIDFAKTRGHEVSFNDIYGQIPSSEATHA